jgi:hypothetical protein
VPSSNKSAVLSLCTIVVHAADAPRPISTCKLRYLQETAVTKPHRMKTCDKKEKTQKNVHTMQRRAAPPTCFKTMLNMFMHKEINVLGASNNFMQLRGKLKHYLDYCPNFRDHCGTTIKLYPRSRRADRRMHLRYAQPRILFNSRGPKTSAVSWLTDNPIVNFSCHRNSPDPVEGYWITHNVGRFY